MTGRTAGFFVVWLVVGVGAGFFASALPFQQSDDSPERAPRIDDYHQNYGDGKLLEPIRLIGADDSFGFLGNVVVVGEWLVVADHRPLRDGNQLLVLDRATGDVVHAAGRAGQGPDEIGMISSVGAVPADAERFSVADGGNNRVAVYNIADWTGKPERLISHRDAWILDQIVLLPGGELVGSGINLRDELLRFYRIKIDNTTELLGSAGALWFPNEHPIVQAVLSDNRMSVSPDGDKIVLASTWINRLEIHERSGELAHIASGPEDVIPRYRVTESYSVQRDLDAGYRQTYTDVASTRDNVFALFSGRQDGLSGELHVFGWEGQINEVYGLAEPVAFLAVDDEGSRLYGIRVDPYPAVVEYAIPPLSDKSH